VDAKADSVGKAIGENGPLEQQERFEELGKESKCYAEVARYKNRFGLGSGKPAARRVDRGRVRKKGLADLP